MDLARSLVPHHRVNIAQLDSRRVLWFLVKLGTHLAIGRERKNERFKGDLDRSRLLQAGSRRPCRPQVVPT
jgi:hypothetical protein